MGLKIVNGPGVDGSQLSNSAEEQVKAAVCWFFVLFFFFILFHFMGNNLQNNSWLLCDQSANQAADQNTDFRQSFSIPGF